MSRWLIANDMKGVDQDPNTFQNEVKVVEQKQNSLSEHPNEGKDVEVKISFDSKENNPEGRDINKVPIEISPNGQQQTKDAIA